MGLGMGCIRLLFFLFTFILWLCGLVIIALCLWMAIDQIYFEALLGAEVYEVVLYTLLACGALICLVGFFGCCGALRESKCLLSLYFVCVIIILVVQLIIAILAIIYHELIVWSIDDHLQRSIDYHYGYYHIHTRGWDTLQEDWKCCGSRDYQDWQTSRWYLSDQTTHQAVPRACCIDPNDYPACTRGTIKANNPQMLFNEGCMTAMLEWVQYNLELIFGLAIAIACIEICSLIFCCCLHQSIEKDASYV
ncbi:CD151 antigen-like [Saccoglossus kowalevskii]|uniref:Tetraspanin n=1 Tax=Saccoglossus kowalevskii TaxID=10224 RepID=A0ABM0MV81_SACKO|nr:PREDICTED: CD151 antigen-like [Saccoglossus kowalevskii]